MVFCLVASMALERNTTELAALELVNRENKAMNSGGNPLSIFVDLSKAFNYLNHNILMSSLSYYGVRGILHDLIKKYLSDCIQFVQHGTLQSNSCHLANGVPQGSILGSFLFSVYINDFASYTDQFSVIIYADNTTLCSTLFL